MSKQNGGIIGPDNVPTGAFGAASGVWKLSDVTDYKRQGTWPVALSGHQVADSCRFNSGSSDYLEKAQTGTNGNQKTWTISMWVKRSTLGTSQFLFSFGANASSDGKMFFDANDFLTFVNDGQNGSSNETDMKFRDVSAWYHIVWACDVTQSDNADRWKIYVNGNQVTLTGSPSISNADGIVNRWNGFDNWIGAAARSQQSGTAIQSFDGYITEIVFIDGQQLTPTSFGETDSVTNNWVPKVVTGLTFGTNGYYLPFTNASALGEDFSGNDNDFTANNLTSIDQSIDTCTNNFCTLNPLDIGGGSYTFSNGNTTINTDGGLQSTFSVGQGKWYAEFKLTGSVNYGIGIRQQNYAISQGYGTGGKSAVLHLDEVNFYKNGSSTASYGSAWSTGDVIQVAADLDNNNIYFGKNGSWWNGSAFSSSIPSTAQSIDDIDNYTFSIILVASGAGNVDANFGSPAYAISSGNVDSSGMGNFEYAVPSGYYSLCTRNLNLIG